ncbi:hypothetical protein [Moorena bouillonii]|uniref:Uncharacterized protein n=1 Tax=Moorena bouillonii PNG TaxID=568701 RepID=A0A1U7NAG7_9CYAN|nr:hypothetical protein [Moorena bouillonii]OLT62933.1 hypothetical protein BJP37_31755 [Moorena bouillonii PNG]
MITISDLNVSRENGLTELKDPQIMGRIMGGRFQLNAFTVTIGNIPFSLGTPLAIDLNGDGTIQPDEVYVPLSGTLSFSFSLGRGEFQRDHRSMSDC